MIPKSIASQLVGQAGWTFPSQNDQWGGAGEDDVHRHCGRSLCPCHHRWSTEQGRGAYWYYLT